MSFLSNQLLCRQASERGLSYSTLGNTIQNLWQLALLRADYVISDCPLTIEGLILVSQDPAGNYFYADHRMCLQKAEGLGGITKGLSDPPPNIQLIFHPFRYYALCKIEEMLQLRIGITYILDNPEGLIQAVKGQVQRFNMITSTEQFIRDVARWNEVVSLAVSVEPFTYNRLFGIYKIPGGPHYDKDNEAKFYREMDNQRAECKKILEEIGITKIQEAISYLCNMAKSLEPNTDIHHVLRFTAGRYRIEKVKGKLGGAVLILTMAEMIRRASEMAFGVELPEEDESGSWDAESLKIHHYGTKRLNDNYKAKATFIRRLGLDYTLRLRWYVEGYTELGALAYLLEGYTKVDIVNLLGEVIANKGKGLSFRETLLNDIQRSVYSWISLDGDREDSIRLVRKAAKDDEMFGEFFISNPDFEIHNFSLEELAEVFWAMALENVPDLSLGDKELLLQETSAATSGKEFFKLARKALPSVSKVDKGKQWGERLGKYSENHPMRQLPNGTQEYRPVIAAIRQAYRIIEYDYYKSRRDCCVSPATGKIVERVSSSTT
ncbi:MAG: hypothetical protein JST85_12220 [Acidobacteria bacterium]|nr:hypothetical protein [Acidobacteriota bacterium]